MQNTSNVVIRGRLQVTSNLIRTVDDPDGGIIFLINFPVAQKPGSYVATFRIGVLRFGYKTLIQKNFWLEISSKK